MSELADLDNVDRATLERARSFMKTPKTVDELLADEQMRLILHSVVCRLERRRANTAPEPVPSTLASRPLKPIDQFPPDAKRLAANDVDD